MASFSLTTPEPETSGWCQSVPVTNLTGSLKIPWHRVCQDFCFKTLNLMIFSGNSPHDSDAQWRPLNDGNQAEGHGSEPPRASPCVPHQLCSAIASSAPRFVITMAPSETLIMKLLCHLRRHLFTLSRVPPTMLASSRWLNRILELCPSPLVTRSIILASLDGSSSKATSAKI